VDRANPRMIAGSMPPRGGGTLRGSRLNGLSLIELTRRALKPLSVTQGVPLTSAIALLGDTGGVIMLQPGETWDIYEAMTLTGNDITLIAHGVTFRAGPELAARAMVVQGDRFRLHGGVFEAASTGNAALRLEGDDAIIAGTRFSNVAQAIAVAGGNRTQILDCQVGTVTDSTSAIDLSGTATDCLVRGCVIQGRTPTWGIDAGSGITVSAFVGNVSQGLRYHTSAGQNNVAAGNTGTVSAI